MSLYVVFCLKHFQTSVTLKLSDSGVSFLVFLKVLISVEDLGASGNITDKHTFLGVLVFMLLYIRCTSKCLITELTAQLKYKMLRIGHYPIFN